MTLDDEGLLSSEFDAVFSREAPEAIEWAFRVWRDRSPFFPPISEIRKLVLEFKRGQRERMELEAKLSEQFLLEEGRRQGQVPDYGEVVNQLRAIVENAKPDHLDRWKRFRERLAMKRIASVAATLDLTEEQIRERRNRERAEIERYREHSDNEFEL